MVSRKQSNIGIIPALVKYSKLKGIWKPKLEKKLDIILSGCTEALIDKEKTFLEQQITERNAQEEILWWKKSIVMD